MTETEKALFICLEALVDTLSKAKAIDARNYVLRIGVVAAANAGQTGTTMTDVLAAHMERVIALAEMQAKPPSVESH